MNLYGCTVRAKTRNGPFVEIQSNSEIGLRCKISCHIFIRSGITLEEGVTAHCNPPPIGISARLMSAPAPPRAAR